MHLLCMKPETRLSRDEVILEGRLRNQVYDIECLHVCREVKDKAYSNVLVYESKMSSAKGECLHACVHIMLCIT